MARRFALAAVGVLAVAPASAQPPASPTVPYPEYQATATCRLCHERIVEQHEASMHAGAFSDPLPQALALTAIVISFGVTAKSNATCEKDALFSVETVRPLKIRYASTAPTAPPSKYCSPALPQIPATPAASNNKT